LLRDGADYYELDDPLAPLAIPATLQDSLMARLDRHASVKELAQVGAVIGREFSRDLLAAVVSWKEEDLDEALRRLVTAELIFPRGLGSEATYVFKHALVRDAAYATLLRTKRRDLHGRVMQVLENLFPDTVETSPDLLALHCAQAGMIEKAIGYWAKAGRQAIARSAMAEAVSHLRRALELLPVLPDTPVRWEQELNLQTALGTALTATKGYSSPETGRAHDRARTLCEQLGDMPNLVRVATAECIHHLMRAEVDMGLRVCSQTGRASRCWLGCYFEVNEG
jgi:predicted ATPase